MSDSLLLDSKYLLELINLLENTYKSTSTQVIKNSNKILEEKLSEPKMSIKILLSILSFDYILDKQITLEIQLCALSRVKYILSKNFKNFSSKEILSLIKSILDLLYNNKKLNLNSILSVILEILTSLLTSLYTITNREYINYLFELIISNINKSKINYFLYDAKISIMINIKILETINIDNKNYETLINKYYLPLVNIIFKNVNYFLDPRKNVYNIEYILLIKFIFIGFCSIGKKAKRYLDNEITKSIFLLFYKEYGIYGFELLQIIIPLDESAKIKYNNPNILVTLISDEEKANELNKMKSKIIEFFYLLLQIYLETDESNDNIDINNEEINEILDLIKKIVVIIMKSLQDIIDNKEKYNLIRKKDYYDYTSSYINLFFDAFIFLSISLTIPKIKQEFKVYIENFILNICFPMVITLEQYENNFFENEPEMYRQYLDNILFIFKERNIRTSICYLLLKICEGYENITYFCLMLSIEMLNYIFNKTENKNKSDENNIYIKNIKESYLIKFNDKSKFDLAILILLNK